MRNTTPSLAPLRSKQVTLLRSRERAAAGFSMVEILVSLVVLSFGMLGMVGMQAASLRANQEARYQSVATYLARELADMLRSNQDIAILPIGTNPYLGTFNSPLTPTVANYCLSVANTACSTATTNAATILTNKTNIANAQMTEWLPRVNAELPSARVAICYDDTPYDGNGDPQWACSNTGSTIVIKLGWTKGSLDRTVQSTNAGASLLDIASRPSVVVPVTAGAL